MPEIISTPQIRKKRAKLKLELAWLNLREKITGSLSDADEKRSKLIRAQLLLRY